MSSDTIEITEAGVALSAALVPWDTETFGLPVARIDRLQVRGRDAEGAAGAAGVAMARLHAWLADRRVGLASCRLPGEDLRASLWLEDAGFRFVEMVYGLVADLPAASPRPLDGDEPGWQPALAADLPALRAIASTAFLTGRLQVDPRIDRDWSGRRYADWVRRSLDHDRHEVLVARSGDALAAFFVVEQTDAETAYWHLTAIAPEFQGLGLGRALWRAMMQRHANQGLRRVQTTIAVRNTPVVNLYASLGWRFDACHSTFHWLPSVRGEAAGDGA